MIFSSRYFATLSDAAFSLAIGLRLLIAACFFIELSIILCCHFSVFMRRHPFADLLMPPECLA